MKLLLDTHIWLWSLTAAKNLSSRVRRELENPGNELWLPPISIWELVILCEKGRIALVEPVDLWIENAIGSVPLHEAPVTYQVALQAGRAGLSHGDLADRFLAATAKVFGLTLVTADKVLIKAPGISVMANR